MKTITGCPESYQQEDSFVGLSDTLPRKVSDQMFSWSCIKPAVLFSSKPGQCTWNLVGVRTALINQKTWPSSVLDPPPFLKAPRLSQDMRHTFVVLDLWCFLLRSSFFVFPLYRSLYTAKFEDRKKHQFPAKTIIGSRENRDSSVAR